MKRSALLLAAGSILLAACGPAEVVVTLEVEAVDPVTGETVVRPASDIEVQILPYNRDMIFDSLTNAFGTPEPEIPAELVQAREEIAAAQSEWLGLQNRWNTLRDTLQTLNDEISRYSRGEPRYISLYNEYEDLDAEYARVERQMEAAFEEFDTRQQASLAQSQEVRVMQENWAAEAFADVDAVMLNKLTVSGLDIGADTTDASGLASFAVKPGEYFIYARVEEAYTELYWNVPLSVVKGDAPVTITLTRANAEVRPKL